MMVNADIGEAVSAMRDGKRVRRAGWNGKGMFVFIVDGADRNKASPWTYTDGKQDNFPNDSFVAMKTAQNTVIPWLCSQADLLACDWEIAE